MRQTLNNTTIDFFHVIHYNRLTSCTCDNSSPSKKYLFMEKNMKKFLKITAVVLVALTMTAMLVACGQDYSEVAGTYEISTLTGEVNGVHVTQDNYEYFRIILTKDGNATVESKASGGGAEYKATGTFTYADGKIALTTRNGSVSVTETYDYEDGKIRYKVSQNGMSLDMLFVKKVENAD